MNLAAVLLGAAATAPDAPALLDERGGRTTYRALADATAHLAAQLVDDGVAPGDRVALVSPNGPPFVVAYLATLHAGAVSVPLHPTAPPAELERQLAAVDARTTLAAGSSTPLATAAGRPVRAVDLDTLPDSAAPLVDRADDDVAVLLFTSGTAGAPRAAMLTHANLAANIGQVQGHPGLALRPDDVALGVLPCSHIFGLNVVLGCALAAGASTLLVERFQPAASARLAQRHGATVLAGVPTMFRDWLDSEADAAPNDAFASVRLAVSGAAALPEPVAAGFRERFGVVVHQGYGLTEASPIVSTTALGPTPPRPGSIGRPLPGLTVRLVDEDGADVLAGDPGEIWVRGPNVFAGYWEDPDATARALAAGWLHTGDVAVVDEHEDLRLVDRRSDLILVGGFNVYPAEVEEALRSHPDVADAAAVGEPSPRTGETVVAYVVPAPGASPDPTDLVAHCGRAIARYKCPTRVEVVGSLPRTAVGKVRRRSLR
ncbi:MAG TPA: AMP-binding protein [Acidimicrobiia bacterium]|nr:AMP-binding protein [Acidimicrobiia bacterium]